MLVLYYQGTEGVQFDAVSSDVDVLKKCAEEKNNGDPLTWFEWKGGWKGVDRSEDDEDFYIITDVPFVPTSSLHTQNSKE